MQQIVGTLRIAGLAGLAVIRVAYGGDVEIDGKFISTASSGPPIEVSSSDLVTGLNADLLDGLSASDLVSAIDHVLVVAKSGGQFSSIQAAIDSIGDAAEDNRYLVWVGPGIYVEEVNVSSEWITLQGAGQRSTVIRSDGDPATITGAGVVRHLTVEAEGDGPGIRGITTCASCSVKISHVTVDVTTSVPTAGVEYGATGVLCLSCLSIEIDNARISTASTNANGLIWGVYGSASKSISIRHAEITANGGLSTTALLVNVDGAGLEPHEPALLVEHVEAHAWGAAYNVGADLQGDPTSLPPLRISRLTASATGNAPSGLRVWNGFATLDNVVVSAEGAGLQQAASFNKGQFEIFQSRFLSPGAAAPGIAVGAGANTPVSIVYSQIVGTFDSNSGSVYTCRGNYDGSLGDVSCPP